MRRFSEAEKQTIWDMREAGVPVKRIARHLGRQPVSLRKFLSGTGGKRPSARERSDLRLSLEERRRSRGAWRPVIPFAPSLRTFVGRLRRYAGRSTPTADARNTGPWWPTRRLADGHCGRRGPSWRPAGDCEGSSSASSRPGGHLSRSRRGWLWSTPIARRCRCPTRPSTSRSSCKAVERCAKSCPYVSAQRSGDAPAQDLRQGQPRWGRQDQESACRIGNNSESWKGSWCASVGRLPAPRS